MENSPQGTSQRSPLLHAEIVSLLAELNSLVADNTLLHNDQTSRSRRLFSGLKAKINEFETNPKKLDLNLQQYTDTLTQMFLVLNNPEKHGFSDELLTGVSETLYIFAKVRGFKFISNYFSSDVYIIDILIDLVENTLLDDFSVFVCLIWLSNLALVPFPLEQVHEKLPFRIYQTALKHLGVHKSASKNQVVSLILLSRLLTRRDSIENGLLLEYFAGVKKLWNPDNGIDQLASVKLGHLMTINKILKKVSNEVVVKNVDFVYYEVMNVDVVTLRYQNDYYEAETSASRLTNLNVLYMIKILTKLSKFYMLRGDFGRVADIINNLLNDIMGPFLNLFDSSLRYGMAKNLANLVKNLGLYAVNFKEQLLLYILELLSIKNLPVPFLEHIGPIGNNVFSAELNIVADDISLTRYHTVLLFIAFAALNKSLPICFIPLVLSIIHKTLFTSQRRMSTSFGNQIRDSSCFIVWAVARSLDEASFQELNHQLKTMMNTVLLDLVKVVIFDDDLNLRKCGTAVIQEFVGMFGRLLFEPCFHEKSVSKTQNAEVLGSFLIQFVELFDSSTTALMQSSYLLIPKLVKLGFKEDLFFPTLMQNMTSEDVPFHVKKLNSQYLATLLKGIIGLNRILFDILPSETAEFDTLSSFQRLFENYSLGNFSSLYAIADLLPLIKPLTPVESRLQQIVEFFAFDHHKDALEKGESFIRFITSCMKCSDPLFHFDGIWETIFAISRVQKDKDLCLEFQGLFKNLHLWQVFVPEDEFSRILHFVVQGNVPLASCLPFLDMTETRFEAILKLLEDTSVGSDIRSQTIEGFMVNLPKHTFVKDIHLKRFIELLDDYTTTTQGDVGSKVRYSILLLVSSNIDYFSKNCLRSRLEEKLLRLAGETIDKIKFQAFRLLSVLQQENVNILQLENDKTYYRELFGYYEKLLKLLVIEPNNSHLKTLSNSFWKGLTFSLGSTAATHSIIIESFYCLLVFIENTSEEQVVFIYQELLSLLAAPDGIGLSKVDLRTSKRYILTLNLLIKLFEASARFPENFDYSALVLASYNHISAPTKLGLVLKIFLHVATSSRANHTLRQQCTGLVVTLSCTNKLAKTRNMASEILFEIINELQPTYADAIRLLDTIEWDDSPAALKTHQEKLSEIFQQL